ncbi:MAG: hypothetical protein JW956_07500 [Calditrichaceae bacterium]|nr:hypothetical protein [Calditrichaceae bacterium]
MSSMRYISPEETSPGKGIGPEDNSHYPQNATKQQGFLVSAFGLALGFTLVILYLLLRIPYLPEKFIEFMPTFWGSIVYSIIVYFTGGIVVGCLLSILYNLLLHKRFELFGIEHSID